MVRTLDEALLARIEDASLNASAPPQQRWLDGWLVRTSPGKAQRARSINPVAPGHMPSVQKLAPASEALREAGLPVVIRLTPFSQPPDLDQTPAMMGWSQDGQTDVLVRITYFRGLTPKELPEGRVWLSLDGAASANAVALLPGSPLEQQRAHAHRLAGAPVPYRGFAVRRGGAILYCGQFAREGNLVGLYDVHTDPAVRRAGLARALCERQLLEAASEGATRAYLQVDKANTGALSVYRGLGFESGYDYHYRHAPAAD